MRKPLYILLFLPLYSFGQLTCDEARKLSIEAEREQGTRQSQLLFDEAIKLCPGFDFAYYEKAVPYLKRGDFITWRRLMDMAVELNPQRNLGDRGWCRYQFMRDYQGAIQDIEKLDSLVTYDIGFSVNGDFHLNIAKALCYKALGEKYKAIEIIESHISTQGYNQGLYDYLYLGILNMEIGNYEKGIECFKKQISFNDYQAESYYYLGIAYKKIGWIKEFKENMSKAKTYYLKNYVLFDRYTEPLDKIYLRDIERELARGCLKSRDSPFFFDCYH